MRRIELIAAHREAIRQAAAPGGASSSTTGMPSFRMTGMAWSGVM
jgi:hypothetical protein